MWNRRCVWALEVAAVILCFGYNGNLQTSSLCLESRLNIPSLEYTPMKRQDNTRKPCPLCLCPLLRDAHQQSLKWTKPEWTSKCFPFLKCFLLYVLAVPLYLNTTKPLDGGYLIREKYCTFNFDFYFKLVSMIKCRHFRIIILWNFKEIIIQWDFCTLKVVMRLAIWLWKDL